jgi:hypothetical protein
MSTVFSEPINLGDLVKYEEDNLFYSRDSVTVAPNQVLALGTVVGMTDSQRVTALAPAATDGSQNAYGILLHAVDTTTPGKTEALVLARECVVSDAYVVWPVGISANDKATAIQQLKVPGILIRQGA